MNEIIRTARASDFDRRPDRALRGQLARLRHWASLAEYCPHAPHPKQWAFLLAGQKEVFFGGAAGPGKTDALAMGALEFVHIPDYRALLLRRTFRQLNQSNSIMNRFRQWLANKPGVRWNAADKRFTFSSGATITFGYCDGDDDVYQYDSSEFHYIGFDELTSFSQGQYRYLFSRLRNVRCPACIERNEADVAGKKKLKLRHAHLAVAHIPLRMRSASNPGNRGHDWVKDWFYIDKPPLTRVQLNPERLYIPASIVDNPSLNREDYEKNLMMLEPVRREQLLRGDWDVRSTGELFTRGDWRFADDYARDIVLVRAWDLAATSVRESENGKSRADWTVGVLIGMTRQGKFFIVDVIRVRKSPAEVEELMRATAEMDGRSVTILIPQDPGSAGKAYANHLITNVLRGFNVVVQSQSGSKYVRAKPMSASHKAHNITLLRKPWSNAFIEECEMAGPDEEAYDHDDQWDAASFGFNYLCENPMEFGWQSGRVTPPKENDPRFDDDDVGSGFGTRRKTRRFGPDAW